MANPISHLPSVSVVPLISARLGLFALYNVNVTPSKGIPDSSSVFTTLNFTFVAEPWLP